MADKYCSTAGVPGRELVVDDEYLRCMRKYFTDTSDKLELVITKYLAILSESRKTGIVSGSAAKALDAYIESAKCLSGAVKQIAGAAAMLTDSFQKQIDIDDCDLF